MKAMAKSTDNGFVAGKNYVFAGFVYEEAFVDLKTELDWKSEERRWRTSSISHFVYCVATIFKKSKGR